MWSTEDGAAQGVNLFEQNHIWLRWDLQLQALQRGPAHGMLTSTPRVKCPPVCYPPFRDRSSRPELTVGCRACTRTWSSLNLVPPHCTHPEGRRWSHPSGVKELSHRDRIQHKRRAASTQDSFPQCALCWGEELGISSHRLCTLPTLRDLQSSRRSNGRSDLHHLI